MAEKLNTSVISVHCGGIYSVYLAHGRVCYTPNIKPSFTEKNSADIDEISWKTNSLIFIASYSFARKLNHQNLII